MIQIFSKFPCRPNRSVFNSRFRYNSVIGAASLKSRHKSTNHSRKSQNIQQTALKLEETERCPPPPAPPSDPPTPKSNLKWILLGGAAIVGAGFLMLKNLNTKDLPSSNIKKVEKFRSPPTTKDIPKHVPYLLIGGGTASFAAFRAIKSNEPKAKIMVISDESVMPYMRPPLSKEIWFDAQLGAEKARFKQWNGAERSLFFEPEDFYLPAEKLSDSHNGGVSVIRGYSVVKINVAEQKVILDDGTELTYEKCLVATGSSPKTLDVFNGVPVKIKERIHSFKSIKDFETVKSQIEKSKSIAIVGNGFLGSELACALSHYGQSGKLKVYQLFHEKGNMAKVLPTYLSEWTTERIKEIGVDVQPESQVVGVEMFEGNQLRLKLSNGKSIIVDNVIQAVGSEPNVELAKEADLEVDPCHGGFVVNAELEARSNLYAAGDVACFYDTKLGRRRVEHHDHAVVSGRLAGENMVGLKKPYKHQSMFWSDLGSAVGYEAIGLVDSSLPTVAVFAKYDASDAEQKRVPYETDLKTEQTKAESMPQSLESTNDKSGIKDFPLLGTEEGQDNCGKGVIFYMKEDKIVGILLWNVFNRISIARKILMSDEKFEDLNEVAKLFDIFEQQNPDKKN